jgi:ribosome maturation factor RimP
MNIFQTQLEGQIANIIEQPLQKMGYEIVRIRLMGSAHHKTLQLMIDRTDGVPINLNDCEIVSRHLSVLFDVEDVIPVRYNLEVSSPGVNRPLTRHKDFVNNVGQLMKLTTKLPVNGQRNYFGTLKMVTDTDFTFVPQESDQELNFAFANVGDAHLQPILEFKQAKPNQKNKRRK